MSWIHYLSKNLHLLVLGTTVEPAQCDTVEAE
jgi:hypothetical protein